MGRFERFAACTFRDFHDVEVLYRSAAGTVYKARFNYDKKYYVLKERVLSELGRRKDITNEVQLLAQLNHTNVIRCEGWFWDERKQALFIVLEYCECGDLCKFIERRKSRSRYFEERYIWYLFHQMCLAVRHLHENGIVHRDLKSLNIMLTKGNKQIKLADLGVSRQVSEDTIMLNTFYGTPLYLSPELVENSAYNEKTDIWSLGVILYEITALRCPFRSRTLLGLARAIKQGTYEALPDHYSPNIGRCIRWLLQVDYTKRPHINQIIKWVEGRLRENENYHGENDEDEVDETDHNDSDTDDDENMDEEYDIHVPKSGAEVANDLDNYRKVYIQNHHGNHQGQGSHDKNSDNNDISRPTRVDLASGRKEKSSTSLVTGTTAAIKGHDNFNNKNDKELRTARFLQELEEKERKNKNSYGTGAGNGVYNYNKGKTVGATVSNSTTTDDTRVRVNIDKSHMNHTLAVNNNNSNSNRNSNSNESDEKISVNEPHSTSKHLYTENLKEDNQNNNISTSNDDNNNNNNK